jgi:hypothetical protein
MDVFIFQKLEEKTARINELFSRSETKNVLDEESLDPNEVKFALVTDLGVLQRFETKQIQSDLDAKKTILVSNIQDLDKFEKLKATLNNYSQKIFSLVVEYKTGFGSQRVDVDNGATRIYFDDIATLDLETLTKEQQNRIERYKKVYDAICDLSVSYDDKKAIKVLRMYNNLISTYNLSSTIDIFAETLSQFTKIKRTIFEQRGYAENTDISIIKSDFEKELLLTQAEIDAVKTPEFQDKLLQQIAEQKEKYSIKGGTLESRVKDFESLNHVMSYRYVKGQSTVCEIPTGEIKPIADDKSRRLRLAKAKAKAIKIKLQLAA